MLRNTYTSTHRWRKNSLQQQTPNKTLTEKTVGGFTSTHILRPDHKTVNKEYMEGGETSKSKYVVIAVFF